VLGTDATGIPQLDPDAPEGIRYPDEDVRTRAGTGGASPDSLGELVHHLAKRGWVTPIEHVDERAVFASPPEDAPGRLALSPPQKPHGDHRLCRPVLLGEDEPIANHRDDQGMPRCAG
jgi:hypothetical protein